MNDPTTAIQEVPLSRSDYRISFPKSSSEFEQDEEWFEVEEGGRRRRLRVHDYAALYRSPGLYEALVYDALGCQSPERVVNALESAVSETARASTSDLRVLDLGAGNGIVAEVLRLAGVPRIVGLDIIPEAADAARRDRPNAYDDYVVGDLAAPQPESEARLRKFAPNCLITVAALGFGDVPTEAFVNALNLLPEDGWLAMCIKDRFLEEDDDSGFGRLLRVLISDGTLRVLRRDRYVHRESIGGEDLHYVALVARKERHARLAG